MWTMSPDGNIDYVNRAWHAYAGTTGETPPGDGLLPAIHPEDAASFRERFQVVAAVDTVGEIEFRLRRADGVYRWHLGHVTALRAPDGAISGWVGTAIDIDARRRAEAALRASEAASREIIEAATDFVYTPPSSPFSATPRRRRWACRSKRHSSRPTN
jgi:PAS domain S-box-containing protein